MIYLYLFGTCFHFIYVFMIIGKILIQSHSHYKTFLNLMQSSILPERLMIRKTNQLLSLILILIPV